MTKQDRVRVVEILRCAADIFAEDFAPISWAHALTYEGEDVGDRLFVLAVRAMCAVREEASMSRRRLLEAALRVEEGSLL